MQRQLLRRECVADRLSAIIEDLFELATDERRCQKSSKKSESQRILDAVVHLGDAAGLAKCVRVQPVRVRPALLQIGERFVLAPEDDVRCPAKREAEEAKRIFDAIAFAQIAIRTARDAKAHLRRRDAAEVRRRGEKAEDIAERRVDARGPLEDESRRALHARFTTGTMSLRIQSGPTRRWTKLRKYAGCLCSYTLWPMN